MAGFAQSPVKSRLFQVPTILLVVVPSSMSQTNPVSPQCADSPAEIVAAPLTHKIQLDAAKPAREWADATPVKFCSDWQGKNPDPARQTQVRALWTPQTLYLRFECRYRELNVFTDSESNGRRDHLWDRDVTEAFLQPDPSQTRYYKEFEVAPNGMWIDLSVSPGPLADLKSGMQRSVWLDESKHTWAAELAIPMKSLTERFDASAVWRANFYRVEGREEPRAYLAWQPTRTLQPNFHVPSAFGRLRFQSAATDWPTPPKTKYFNIAAKLIEAASFRPAKQTHL